MYDEDEKRIAFGKLYCNNLFIGHVISITVILFLTFTDQNLNDNNEKVAAIGQYFSSIPFLLIHIFILIVSILWSKNKSNYRGALFIPPIEEFSVNWNSLQKAPFARRFGVKLRYWIQKLSPLRSLASFLVILIAGWILTGYIVICFGAPLLNEQIKTACFVTELCILSIWPIILIEGPNLDKIKGVLRGEDLDSLSNLLYKNAFGAIFGAWLGAIPIPLDWDRSWQIWPLTCVIGCYFGAFLGQIVTLYEIQKVQKKRKTIIGESKKRKVA